MKIIVTPGPNGLISTAGQIIGQALPEGAMLVDVASLDIPPMSAAIVEGGEVKIVANWLGSGPWFDQQASTADRLTPMHVTEYGVNPEALGWKMTPRPETAAEKKAREAIEAKAKADAEAARISTMAVPLFAIRKVFRETKAEDGTSYLAKVEEAKASGVLSEDAYEAITMLDPVKRSSPYIAEFQTVFGFTAPQVDALFVAASGIPV